MSEQNKTIYEVWIFHEPVGRRVVIRELIEGRGSEDDSDWIEVADFVGMWEHEWLEHNGKQPWYAYRRMTAVSDGKGGYDEITMHPPGSYRIIPDERSYRSYRQ